MNKLFICSLLGIFLFVGFFSLNTAKAQEDGIAKGLRYIAQHQNADGGVFDKDQSNSQDVQTAWSIYSFASAGFDPSSVINQKSLIDFERSRACKYTAATDIERSLIVLNSANFDLSLLDCDLSAKLENLVNQDTGQIGESIVSTIFGVFALQSQGLSLPQNTLLYLESNQRQDGGWNSGWETESNITAQAIQAISILSEDHELASLIRAKAYLKNLQTEDGGIKYSASAWTTGPDAFSDAYTLEAIYSLGESPLDEYWISNGNSILAHLEKYQKNDGSFYFSFDEWGDATPIWTTATVLPALSGKFFVPKNINLKPYESAPTIMPSPVPSVSPDSGSATPAPSVLRSVSPVLNVTDSSLTDNDLVAYDQSLTGLSTFNTEEPITKSPLDEARSPVVLGDTVKTSNSTYLFFVLGLVVGLGIVIIFRKFGILSIFFIAILLFGQKALAESNKVGLIIRHSNGDQKQYCLTPDSLPASSVALFKSGGLNYELDRGFLVSLDSERALTSSATEASKKYWSHWINQGGGLSYANYGAETKFIKAGQIDAWQVGSSDRLLTDTEFEQVCPPETATAIATQTIEQPLAQQNDAIDSPDRTKRTSNSSDSKTELTTQLSPVSSSSVEQAKVLGDTDARRQQPYIYLILGILIPIAISAIAKLSRKFRK